MKKIVLSALSGAALLALSACGDAEEEVVTEDTALVEEDPATVDMNADDSMMADTTTDTMEADDTVSIDENGVEADINDGDTSVEADIDEDPSMTVQD